MFVDARFRRTLLALDGSLGARIKLVGRTSQAGWMGIGEVVAIDEPGNALELLLEFRVGKRRFSLPFEMIEAVWHENGGWHVRIPGYVDSLSSGGTSPEYEGVEAVFIDVLPMSRQQREREQQVRITSFPHESSLLREVIGAVRRRLRTRGRR